MSTVYEITKMATTTDKVALGILDASLLTLKEQTVSADGKSVSATYSYATGDAQFPVTVVSRIFFDEKADNGFGKWTYTLTLNTWETQTVDSVQTWAKKVTFRLGCDLPGMGVYSVQELWDGLGSLFGLLFPSTDGSDVASMATLTKFAFNIPTLK